jgi:hypothetical protein
MMCQKLDQIHRINIRARNRLLEQVKYFKYLDSSINQDGRCIMGIRFRITQEKSAFIDKKPFHAPIV